jgi:hypothetical protein
VNEPQLKFQKLLKRVPDGDPLAPPASTLAPSSQTHRRNSRTAVTIPPARNGQITGTVVVEEPDCTQVAPSECPNEQTNTWFDQLLGHYAYRRDRRRVERHESNFALSDALGSSIFGRFCSGRCPDLQVFALLLPKQFPDRRSLNHQLHAPDTVAPGRGSSAARHKMSERQVSH